MTTFFQDLGQAARGLAKRPTFSLTLILVLGLGVAANTCIFSVVSRLILRPLSFHDPDNLVEIRAVSPQRDWDDMAISYPDLVDFQGRSKAFAALAIHMPVESNLTSSEEPERVAGHRVSANFFSVLGVRPALGRTFSPEEENLSTSQVVILSDNLWRHRFGGDPALVGKTVFLDEAPHRVIGILPASFQFTSSHDQIWLPLDFDLAKEVRLARRIFAIGRLKPGVSIRQAGTEVAAIAAQLERAYPESNSEFGAAVVPLYQVIYGKGFARSWTVTWVAVLLLLLIACVNATNLLLTRAAARERELAFRTVLGANRRRLLRHFMAESCVLALLGCALAVFLSQWGMGLLKALLPEDLPRSDAIGWNGEAFVFTLALSFGATLLCSLLPALRASRPDLSRALKDASRGSEGKAGRRLRSTLIVVEMALSVMLVVVAGLIIQSFRNLEGIDRGFRTNDLYSLRLTIPAKKYPDKAQIAVFFGQVLEQLRNLPGVRSVGAINELPTGRYANWVQAFTVQGDPPPRPGLEPVADSRIVSPGYFQTLGVPIVHGRDFTFQDTGTPRVVAISDSLAREFFPGREPLGRRIVVQTIPFEIVAVVGDLRQSGPREPMRRAIYFPFTQARWYTMSFVLATPEDPARLAPAVRAAVSRVNPSQPIYSVQTLQEEVRQELSQDRALAQLLGVFVLSALLLAVTGLYGVVSYSVAQRSREMGIRMALGARRREIVGMVIRQGMGLTLIGLAVGFAGALAASRVISRLLFEIDARDPRAFAVAAVILTAVALLASYLPARRAATVDPIETLRSEV